MKMRSTSLLVALTLTAGGCAAPEPELITHEPLSYSTAELERSGEAVPQEIRSNLRSHLEAARSAMANEQPDAAVPHIVAFATQLGELPDEEAAIDFGVDMATALDRDLVALAVANRGEGWTDVGDKMWNMKCEHDGPAPGGNGFVNMRCVVERGRYCRLLIYKGQVVGCVTGKMPNAP